MKITKAYKNEVEKIKMYFKHSFPEAQGTSIEAYFDVYFDVNETMVLRNDKNEILALAQVKPKVISLGDKKLKTHLISHVMTRPEFQGKGYMNALIQGVLSKTSKDTLLTVLKPYEPNVFRSLGFENVIATTEYNIATKDIPSMSTEGILLSPFASDLKQAYEAFTEYFDGHFDRDDAYYDALKEYVMHRKGNIIGFKEAGILKGYCVYLDHPTHTEVIECVYDTSGTLIKLLSFVSKGKHRVLLKASTSEKIHKLFPKSMKTNQPFMMARINDQALFERLYGLKIISAYSGFNVSAKPLFNRDFQ